MVHRLLTGPEQMVQQALTKGDIIPPHPHSWWQSTEVQAALVTGVCLIVAYAVGALIKHHLRKRKSIKQAETHENL